MELERVSRATTHFKDTKSTRDFNITSSFKILKYHIYETKKIQLKH